MTLDRLRHLGKIPFVMQSFISFVKNGVTIGLAKFINLIGIVFRPKEFLGFIWDINSFMSEQGTGVRYTL